MRRQLLMVLAAAALVVPSGAALAHHKDGHSGGGGNGNACPENSQNPHGRPPSCGKQRPPEGGAKGGSKGRSCSETSGNGNARSRCGTHSPAERNPQPPLTQCNDGADNDADGRADASDPNDCRGSDATEGTTQCNDGVDNDRDGSADTRDGNDCRAGDVTEATTECNDGFDNDGDGKADGSDANDCRGDDVVEDTASCESGGLGGENTVANEFLDTENEDGPLSSELHADEGEFGAAAPVVHEASCLVAAVEDLESAP